MISPKISSRLSVEALVVGLLVMGSLSGLLPVHAASDTLNNVQVFVQTTNTNINSYSLTVYNSSGYQIISSSSIYAGFGLELPDGTYLITTTATQEGSYYPTVYSTSVQSIPANSSTAVISPPIREPVNEYGYALQTISGPATINIKSTPLNNVPTTTVSINVSYINGTGAAGVWVYSSVVGGYYYYGLNTKAVMANQTAPNGSTTLVVPTLPILLQGYTSIPITLQKSTTTTTTTIGGQSVNITMYWVPNYVQLTGTALIIPPQTNAQITLKVQQSNYITQPYATGAVTSTVTATPAASNSASEIINNSPTPAQIPPFEGQSVGTSVSSPTSPAQFNTTTAALIGITIVIVVIAGVAAFALRKHR